MGGGHSRATHCPVCSIQSDKVQLQCSFVYEGEFMKTVSLQHSNLVPANTYIFGLCLSSRWRLSSAASSSCLQTNLSKSLVVWYFGKFVYQVTNVNTELKGEWLALAVRACMARPQASTPHASDWLGNPMNNLKHSLCLRNSSEL